jgi:hypothetical protein
VPVPSPAATAAAATTTTTASAPAAGTWRGAAAAVFDGFRLGSRYGSEVMTRDPYKQPCDDDPIDGKRRRFMVYGARPCRDRTFPEGTTVGFYLAYADSKSFDEPIEAFMWLGGNYFATRSDFPLKTGLPAAAAADALGAVTATFKVGEEDKALTVQKHPGDTYSVVEGGALVGFVIGPMPGDPENEQWRALHQMYFRYTKPKP